MSTSHYTPLPSSAKDSSDDLSLVQSGSEAENLVQSNRQPCTWCQRCSAGNSARTAPSSLSFWAIIVSLLSVCLNCAIFLATSKLPVNCIDPMMSITNDNIHVLRRPNPFVGLDTVKRPVPPIHREFVNFAQVVQQVDGQHPQFVYDDDPLRYMTVRGLVSPEEKRVQVTPSVSTLFQFRAVDYGMELCELHVQFPVSMTTSNTSRPFLVSLHRLESSLPLNTRTLSYKTKPQITSTLKEFRINPGSGQIVNWSQQFRCEWDQLLTFELACYDPARLGDSGERNGCWLEWWQDRELAKDPAGHPAVYLKQISTV